MGRLGIKTGLEGLNNLGGNSNNSNSNRNNYNSGINSKKNGLLISEEQLAENRKNGDTNEMMVDYNGNDELCENWW